jgi:hypothetical protein
MKHKVLCAILVVGLLVPGAIVYGESSNVIKNDIVIGSLVISQVQVSGLAGANDEYIELFNFSNEVVNLATWSVQYKPASGSLPLAAKKNLPDYDLKPGQYFLLAHSGFAGEVVPDVVHSSFSLSGSGTGATVFLVNSTSLLTAPDSASVVDRLGYGTAETNYPFGQAAPLPESGYSLMRVKFEQNNFTDYEIRLSSPRNTTSVMVEEVTEPTPTPQPTPTLEPEPTVTPTPTPTVTTTPAPTSTPTPTPIVTPTPSPIAAEEYPTQIRISEFLPNPIGIDSGNEWVELYNASSQAVDLTGWVIIDSAAGGFESTSAVKLNSVSVPGGAYLQIAIPAGKFALNNSGSDNVRLYWPNGELIDEVQYSEPVKENLTWCLIADNYQWCEPTPGLVNLALVQPTPTPTPTPVAIPTPTPTPTSIDYSNHLIEIVEVLPDPPGADSGKEYVVVYNRGSTTINLKGWILDDGAEEDVIGSSALVLPEVVLASGQEYKVIMPSGRFALDNSAGDTVRLFNPNKELVDVMSYEQSEPLLPYVKSADGWEWGGVRVSNESGEVAGETLPRTGTALRYWVFATIPAIWYITGKLKTIIKQYEQTGSYRSISCQIGRGQNGSGKIIGSIRGSCN